MAQLNFDATQVAPDMGFETIPAGWYNAMIDESEMKPTKDGSGAYLNCRFNIIDGQYANRKVFMRLNLRNANPTAQEIAYKQLSAIAHAVGVLHVQDSAQLHGIPMKIKVKLHKDSTGQYEDSNEITTIKNINEQVDMGGGAPQAGGFGGAPQGGFAPQGGMPPGFGAPQGGFQQPQQAPVQQQPAQQPWQQPAQAPQAAPQQQPWQQPQQQPQQPAQQPQQAPAQGAPAQQPWQQPNAQQPWQQPAQQAPQQQAPVQQAAPQQQAPQGAPQGNFNPQTAVPPWAQQGQ